MRNARAKRSERILPLLFQRVPFAKMSAAIDNDRQPHVFNIAYNVQNHARARDQVRGQIPVAPQQQIVEDLISEPCATSGADPCFTLVKDIDRVTAVLTGEWVAGRTRVVGEGLADALQTQGKFDLNLTRVERLDSVGALSILHAIGDRPSLADIRARPETTRFLALIDRARRLPKASSKRRARPSPMSALGGAVVATLRALTETFAFSGHAAAGVARCLAHPSQTRWVAMTAHAHRAGIDAIPIIAITSFFVGAVVGLLGVHMLQQFGAQVFAVELIGVAVLREFGVIITAVLLAGRSASAFAAEIGAMQMQQEVDAMRVMGVNPIDALVVPRLGALLLMTPLLTFVAMISGLLGGLLVTWSALDLAPVFFLQRIVDNVGVAHFWVGMSKAPLMAAVIAGIGCHQGLEVGGDVESLGRRVTTAVVRAIFAIIAIDAIFALVYMELNV